MKLLFTQPNNYESSSGASWSRRLSSLLIKRTKDSEFESQLRNFFRRLIAELWKKNVWYSNPNSYRSLNELNRASKGCITCETSLSRLVSFGIWTIDVIATGSHWRKPSSEPKTIVLIQRFHLTNEPSYQPDKFGVSAPIKSIYKIRSASLSIEFSCRNSVLRLPLESGHYAYLGIAYLISWSSRIQDTVRISGVKEHRHFII